MRHATAGFSLILLAACSQAEPAGPAPKDWTRSEQVEIARERNIIAGQQLFDSTGHQVNLAITPAVFEDWERMRAGLK